jgi:hypothetical protein
LAQRREQNGRVFGSAGLPQIGQGFAVVGWSGMRAI